MIRLKHLVVAISGLVLVGTGVVATAVLRRRQPGVDVFAGGSGGRGSPNGYAEALPDRATRPYGRDVAERSVAVAAAGHGGNTAARSLVDRLIALLGSGRPLSEAEEAELQSMEAALARLGEAAVAPLIAGLERGGTGATRDRLFNLLRQLPGAAAEDRLIMEARAGIQDSTRTMAMESLAHRRTPRALESLAAIARSDPGLPARPLITSPRDPHHASTELPDEETFTPRMQAMLALASTGDPRSIAVLTEVARTGPDESLRMEAARNLQRFRSDPRAAETLRLVATSDPSPYARLAALHSLDGSDDRTLAPVLQNIAARDRDAGVRALAQRVLATLGQ